MNRSARIALATLIAIALPAIATPPATQPYTARSIEEAVKELHARSQPATFDDLIPAKIPDEANGAVAIQKAAKVMVSEKSGPRSSAESFPDAPPYTEIWFKLAREAAAANAQSIDLIHQARVRGDAVAWIPDPNAKPADRMIRGLAEIRNLANILNDNALLMHLDGDEAGAFDRELDCRYLASATSQRPFLVGSLVTIGLRAMDACNYHIMATGLQLKDPSRPDFKGGDRKAVAEAISYLLDDASIRREVKRAVPHERIFALDQAAEQGLTKVPQWQESLPSILQFYDDLAAGFDRPAWQNVMPATRPTGPYGVVYEQAGKSFEKIHSVTMGRVVAIQRAAAVALAANLYRLDKAEYPKSLEDLVPTYLPALPIDPFSRTGEPLLYVVLDNGKRPRIGSVGPDGIDQGLQEEAPEHPQLSLQTVQDTQSDDMWADLSACHPVKKP